MLGGGRGPRLVIEILTDATKAQAGLKDTATTAGKVQSGLGRLAGPALGALGALALLGGGAAAAASDTEQAFGAIESVYKDNADAAKVLARSASTDVGLASSEYAQLAAVLGAQLKNLGTAQDDLVPSTDRLIDLGADLSATFGGSTADAVGALSSLLRGERDPIERYGVSIKQADIDARLAAQGLKGLTGDAKRQAEATATLAILTEQTADAQGAFARETDTAAHATQVSEAAMKDAGAAIGVALLPLVVHLATAFADVARWAGENADLVRIVAVVVGILAGAIVALNVALGVYNTLTQAWALRTQAAAAAQWLLNAAMAANPIGLVVIAIVALVAAIVLLWQNSETFRKIVTAAFEAVQKVVAQVIAAVIGILRSAVGTIQRVFGPVLEILSAPIRAYLGIWRSIIGLILALIGAAVRVVGGIMAALAGVLAGPFNTLLGVVRSVLGTVGNLLRAGLAVAQGIFATLTGVLRAPFDKLLSIVSSVFGKIRSIAKGVADYIAGIFRRISGVIDSITGALNAIPNVSLPFSVAPPPGGVAGPSTFRARGAAPTSTAGRGGSVTLVLDGQVFGRATIRALRGYDRLNGAAQVVPRWS